MIKNKYLFSSQFLDYLKNQKISDKETFEGFVKTIKTLNVTGGSSSQIIESNYANIISYLQFAFPNKLEIYNKKRATKFSYLYEGFPLEKKVSCINILSNPGEIDSTASGYYPAFDLIHLLKKEKLEWGILTDGSVWRLYSTLSALPYENYVEIDFSDDNEDNYKVFWQLFTLHLFIPDENDVTQLEKYIEESEKEAKVIEDHIKNNIDEILENICFGFLTYSGKDKQPLSEEEKEIYFENAVYLLFRMLFILYAESRELLPIDKPEYQKISFNSLLEIARQWLSSGIPSQSTTELWDAFRDLTIHIEYGENTIGIPEYDGGLFDNRTRPFLTDPQNKLTNEYFVKVLYKIGYLSKKKNDIKIEYRDLSVRSIGSLYEGILEYKLFIADRDYVIRGKKIIPKSSAGIIKKTDREIPKGHVYFSQDAFERHDTGSYYTPEDVVNYMVQNSVRLGLEERWIDFLPTIKKYESELIKAVNDDTKVGLYRKLNREVVQFIEDKILTFKVMDPAMGSGHFSVNSLNAITHFVIEVLQKKVLISDGPIKHDKEIIDINWELFNYEDTVIDLNPVDWRRRIVEKCIFGIDINPLATELAKLSLWIASASKGKPLTFLDHHLKCGDSIMGVRLQDIMVYPSSKKKDEESNLWEHIDKSKIEAIGLKIQHLLSIDSDRVDNVYEKKEEYSQIEKEPYLNNLKDVATLWLMINFEVQKDGNIPLYLPDSTKYYELLDGASQYIEQNKWIEFIGRSLKDAIDSFTRKKKVFHWELEFIELINFQLDSIIANPPYVEIKVEEYIGITLCTLASRNLYSLIIEKSLSNLNEQSCCSFIVPITIVCSERFHKLQTLLKSKKTAFLSFAERPSKIFINAEQKVTVIITSNKHSDVVISSNYTQWNSDQRKILFTKILQYTELPNVYQIGYSLPKIGNQKDLSILNKLLIFKPIGHQEELGNFPLYFRTSGGRYFKVITNYSTGSSKEASIGFKDQLTVDILTAVFNSNLFFWFYILISNTRDFYSSELLAFPFDLQRTDMALKGQLQSTTMKLMAEIEKNSLVKNNIKYYNIRKSKLLIDQIDIYLKDYYGFLDDELEYIINFQSKYRNTEDDL